MKMIKKDSEEYAKIMAQMEVSRGGTAYEEPYETLYEGKTVLIVGHKNGDYIGVLNGKIIYIQAGKLF